MKQDAGFNIIKPQPLMIVISGPSGAGKDSVIRRMKKRGLPFHFVITATSRTPRGDEIHGRDYLFVSRSRFEQMIRKDELLEHAIVYNEYKGIPKLQVRRALASGKDVVLRVDVQGAATIRKIEPQAVLIFLTTKNKKELVGRLNKRRSETSESMATRMKKVHAELKCAGNFDYVVVNENGKLNKTVEAIISIIDTEHRRVHPRRLNLITLKR